MYSTNNTNDDITDIAFDDGYDHSAKNERLEGITILKKALGEMTHSIINVNKDIIKYRLKITAMLLKRIAQLKEDDLTYNYL